MIPYNNSYCSFIPWYKSIRFDEKIFFKLLFHVKENGKSYSRAWLCYSVILFFINYLRNTTSQNRLGNIAILNTERSLTDEQDLEKLIDNFAM